MGCINELYQSADWKTEKHVPVIDILEEVFSGEGVKVCVCIGKEVPHPNKTEHHIRWIDLYFHPDGEKFPIHIGRAEFHAHGASAKGPDTSGVYTCPWAIFCFRPQKSGRIIASSYCNIHGLWENCKELNVK